MRAEELDFDLPAELIAQVPAENRADSRLLHYVRASGATAHHVFSDLPALLRRGDLLVFNDSKVIAARFALRKATGGRIEGLFLAERDIGEWDVLLRDAGNTSAATRLDFEGEHLAAEVIERRGEGEFRIRVLEQDQRHHAVASSVLVPTKEPAAEILARVGRMPLPPYIRRDKQDDWRDEMDRQRYQTVYAKTAGAVAAPTAGLHFTPELLRQLDEKGVERTSVTLHVGIGTFKPVSTSALENHQMHREEFMMDEAAADALNRAKRDGRRIVAVGTTSARVLETRAAGAPFRAGSGSTAIFIYPPYQWRHVGALVTNFHLPRSTLIAMVAAMTGLEEQRRIYREAIAQGYRFFSYGDAMLIE